MSVTLHEPATLLIESQDGFDSVVLNRTATIGRDRKCDVVIDHPTASRMHARIWQDAEGWHYQDMGSQNGTKLGETKLHTPITLADGTALRIGRVQTYFFRAGVPDNWKPPEQAGRAGKLIRCRCGHIGWAPQYTLGMTLHCVGCGRDLVHKDVPHTTTSVTIDCAACHATIEPSEKMHVCDECGSQLHASCYEELGGCATYGCSKVRHESHDDPNDIAYSTELDLAVHSAPPSNELPDSIRYRLAQCGLMILVGLPIFGVPAIAFAAHRLLSAKPALGWMRLAYALVTFTGGAIGFIASAYWWLGVPRPWRIL